MTRSSRSKAGVVAALAVALLAGCAAPVDRDASGSGPSPRAVPSSAGGASSDALVVPLIGTTWYLVARVSNGLSIQEPADPDARVRFTADTLTLHAIRDPLENSEGGSCPTVTLPATVSNGVVDFGVGAENTLEAAGDLCGWWNLAFADGAQQLVIEGRELRMTSTIGGDGEPTDTLVQVFSMDKPDPPKPPDSIDLGFLPPATADRARDRLSVGLLGKSFRATEITGRAIVDPGITVTAGLDQLALYGGCNQGSVTFSLIGDSMTFGLGRWTEMGCGSGPLGDQEAWLQHFFRGDVRLDRDDEVLRLTSGGQTLTLVESGVAAEVPGPRDDGAGGLQFIVDEIVAPDGVHPMPVFEQGTYWSDPPMVTVYPTSIHINVWCGILRSATTGEGDHRVAGGYLGRWVSDCPPNRTALSDALRYILSGAVIIEWDGPFVTITGRDGLAVSGHSSF